eukprot:6197641-Pleurochrysis_carterae.AAC.2
MNASTSHAPVHGCSRAHLFLSSRQTSRQVQHLGGDHRRAGAVPLAGWLDGTVSRVGRVEATSRRRMCPLLPLDVERCMRHKKAERRSAESSLFSSAGVLTECSKGASSGVVES